MIITYLQATGRPIFARGVIALTADDTDVNVSFKQFVMVVGVCGRSCSCECDIQSCAAICVILLANMNQI